MNQLKTGEPAPRTLEIKRVLERALEQEPHHAGLCHLYLHMVEMSSTPQDGLEVADRLVNIAPDSGHLIHMATHIYIQLGMYNKSLRLNQLAYERDMQYIEREGHMCMHSLSLAHELHFVAYCAMLDCQFEVAREAAQLIHINLPHQLMQHPMLVERCEPFIPTGLHVLMRFGKWEEILALPFPSQPDIYQYTTATLHFTRATAYASLGHVNDALAEEQLFLAAFDNLSDARILSVNRCKDILKVAKEMLRGEITYRQANYRQAFEHLRKAVQLEDGLNYDEPWPWMQPVRHALGALLLEQGRLEEAEEAFRQDLSEPGTVCHRSHPDNVWSLHGLKRCLEQQGRVDEAREVDIRFQQANARADVEIRAPCFCARHLLLD